MGEAQNSYSFIFTGLMGFWVSEGVRGGYEEGKGEMREDRETVYGYVDNIFNPPPPP